jgi:hypothetical protein
MVSCRRDLGVDAVILPMAVPDVLMCLKKAQILRVGRMVMVGYALGEVDKINQVIISECPC